MPPITRIAVIGGGAAGFFAAITAAEALGAFGEVTLYEATPHLLAKVRVSGGGRCNVTHACFEPAELVKKYPRGGRELLGAFHRFQPRDTVAWFAARGVETKTEEDGRMFPVTDDSQTIIECLMAAARKAEVKIIPSMGVRKAEWLEKEFLLTCTDGSATRYDRLIIATGGNKSSGGLAMAESFGHTIIPPVPSLFTFHIQDTRLHDLSGVSVENVVLTAPGTKLQTEQAPPLNGIRADLIVKLQRTFLGLKQNGIPTGETLSVGLRAFGDLDGCRPFAVHLPGRPNRDVGLTLGLAGKPSRDQSPIPRLDDRRRMTARHGVRLEDELRADQTWLGGEGDHG